METRQIEADLKDKIEATKKASLEEPLSKTLKGKEPISYTQDEADIGKTTSMANKEEPPLAPKDPDDKPSGTLKRRIKPIMPKRDYERECFDLKEA